VSEREKCLGNKYQQTAIKSECLFCKSSAAELAVMLATLAAGFHRNLIIVNLNFAALQNLHLCSSFS
jgi:hypothetical protein